MAAFGKLHPSCATDMFWSPLVNTPLTAFCLFPLNIPVSLDIQIYISTSPSTLSTSIMDANSDRAQVCHWPLMNWPKTLARLHKIAADASSYEQKIQAYRRTLRQGPAFQAASGYIDAAVDLRVGIEETLLCSRNPEMHKKVMRLTWKPSVLGVKNTVSHSLKLKRQVQNCQVAWGIQEALTSTSPCKVEVHHQALALPTVLSPVRPIPVLLVPVKLGPLRWAVACLSEPSTVPKLKKKKWD